MKDVTIKGKTIKRELLWLLGCYVAAFAVNVYAVVHYQRPAIELISQLGFVTVIAATFYIAVALVRALVYIIKYPMHRHSKK